MDNVKDFSFKLTALPSTTWLTAGELQSRKRLREETDMDLGDGDQQQSVRRVKTATADQGTCELWSTRNDSCWIDSTHNASSSSSDVSEYSSINSDSKVNSYLDTTLSMSDTSWTDCDTESASSSYSECSRHTEQVLNDIEHNFAVIALECVRKNREQKKADVQNETKSINIRKLD